MALSQGLVPDPRLRGYGSPQSRRPVPDPETVPYSKSLFIAMIHRKVFNIKIVNIHFKWRKFLRNIRE